jgi:hypothetical protein
MLHTVTLNFDTSGVADIIASISHVIARRPGFDWRESLADLIALDVTESAPDVLSVRATRSPQLIAMAATH